MATPQVRLPYDQAFQEIEGWRDRNVAQAPQLADMSPRDLARLHGKEFNSRQFEALANAGPITQAAGWLNRVLGGAGEAAEQFIGQDTGLGRGANMIVNNADQFASILGGFFAPIRYARFALPAIGTALAASRTHAATDDAVSATASGASIPLSFAGAMVGGKALGQFGTLGRITGNVLGGMPGDIPEIALSPRPESDGVMDRMVGNLKEFFGDSANRTGYLIAQLPMAGIEVVNAVSQKMDANRRATIMAARGDEFNAENILQKFALQHIRAPNVAIRRDVARRLNEGTISQQDAEIRLLASEQSKLDDASRARLHTLVEERTARQMLRISEYRERVNKMNRSANDQEDFTAMSQDPNERVNQKWNEHLETARTYEMKSDIWRKRYSTEQALEEDFTKLNSIFGIERMPEVGSGDYILRHPTDKAVYLRPREDLNLETAKQLGFEMGPRTEVETETLQARMLQDAQDYARERGFELPSDIERIVEQSRGVPVEQVLRKYIITDDPKTSSADSELQAISQFLAGIKTVAPEHVTVFENEGAIKGFYDLTTRKLGLNVREQVKPRLFGKLSHELSHKALHEFEQLNPVIAHKLVQHFGDKPMSYRMALLRDFAELTGAKDLDLGYLAGRDFDTADPMLARKITYEMTGGIVEMLARHSYETAKPFQSNIFFRALPLEIQAWLRSVVEKLTAWLGPQRPTLAEGLSVAERTRVQSAINALSDTILDAEVASAKAYELLSHANRADPATLIDSFEKGPFAQIDYLDPNFTIAPPDFRAYAKEIAHAGMDKINLISPEGISRPVKWVMSGLSRARRYPFTRKWYDQMNDFRPRIKLDEGTHIGRIGRDPNQPGTFDSDLRAAEQWLGKVGRSKKLRAQYGKVFHINQRRNHEGQPILSRDKMREMGITKERDLQVIDNINNAGPEMAHQVLQYMTETDTNNLARILYPMRAHKMSTDQAIEASNVVTARGQELGLFHMQLERIKAQAEKKTLTDEQKQELAAREQMLQLRQQAMRKDTEIQLRELLNETDQPLGSDISIETALDVATAQGAVRVKHAFSHNTPGYIPMFRPEPFVILAYGTDEDGRRVSLRAEGRKTMKEAEAVARKMAAQEDVTQVDVLDKKSLAHKYRLFTPANQAEFRKDAQRTMSEIINRYTQQMGDQKTSETEAVLEAISSISKEFEVALTDDLRNAIGVKGDPTQLQRQLIDGFDPNNYLPNLISYINMQTIIGRKSNAASRAELEMLQPEVRDNPQLLAEMKSDTNYVLNATKGEWSTARKMVFYYYLAMSPRYLVQNAFQVYLTGINQMAADSGSVRKSYSHYMRGAKLGLQYVMKGTTGVKAIDTALLHGDDNRLFAPQTLEIVLPGIEDPKSGSSASLFLDGSASIGSQAKARVQQAQQRVEDVLRSWTGFSETVNRRWSFIMGMLNGMEHYGTRKPDGKKQYTSRDQEAMYNYAKNFMDNVNFTGSKVNRPGFIRNLEGTAAHGPVMSAFALQSFSVNQISQLAQFWKEGKIGSLDVMSGKRRADGSSALMRPFNLKNPSVKAFYISLAHLGSVAGIMGMVAFEDLDNLMNHIFGVSLKRAIREGTIKASDLFELDKETGSRIADGFTNGLPGALGVTSSQSLGLGSIVGYRTGQPYGIDNLFGATGGMVKRVYNGVSTALDDPFDGTNMMQALRESSPTGLTYLLRNMDAFYENTVKTAAGQPIVERLSDTGQLSLLAGFLPQEVVTAREQQQHVKHSRRKAEEERRSTVMRIAAKLQKGDKQGASEIYGEFLKKWPERLRNEASLMESIQLERERFARPLLQRPDLLDDRFIQEAARAYPTESYPTQSRVSSALGASRAAIDLSRPEALLQTMSQLQSLPERALVDMLVQAGLSPALVSLLLQPSIPGVRALSETQTSLGPFQQGLVTSPPPLAGTGR